jgi:uncharacterized metal-binding protein
MKDEFPNCAECEVPSHRRSCLTKGGSSPASCPTRDRELRKEALKLYSERDLREFALQASIQEGEGYLGREPGNACPRAWKPRILETAEFAARMGYTRLGLVFCVGLAREAAAVCGFLQERGFEVVSVVCKAGGIPKEELGVEDHQKIRPGEHEPMCNPVLQALALNRAETHFNIVLGLCVGHDSIFLKHSRAYCTVLAAKDRPTGHNPLAAVYTLGSYYRYLGSME